jgi:hypothetical protein
LPFRVDWTPGNAGTSLTESDVAVAAYTPACNAGVCVPQAGTTQQLDSIADNLANSDTPGFVASRPAFHEMLPGDTSASRDKRFALVRSNRCEEVKRIAEPRR